MNKNFFKITAICFCAMFLSFGAGSYGQTDNHFIYIQAKNKQPFYVILNKKVYSSSTIGYLIIPKLKNGSYTLKIGYPKQSAPEKEFGCVVNDADVGYSLQNDDNGQSGLLDLQTQKFIASSGGTDDDGNTVAASNSAVANTGVTQTAAAQTETAAPQKATSSAFGDMLSSVANDSTLKQQPIAVMPKTDAASQVNETVIQNADTFGKNPQADAQAVIASNTEKHLKPANIDAGDQTYGVIKSSENSASDGQQMTFVLFNSRSTDTVQITIPGSQTESVSQVNDSEVSSSQNNVAAAPKYGDRSLALFKNSDGDTIPTDDGVVSTDSKPAKRRKDKNRELPINTGDSSTSTANGSSDINNPFYNKSNGNGSDTNNTNSQDDNSPNTDTPPCDNPVSNSDIQKMEKKMLRKGNDDDMLVLADKAVKGKCITSQQVKELGRLFLSDAGRFAFYQDAYPSVSDKANYVALQNQLLDAYFKKKFTDMLQNQ